MSETELLKFCTDGIISIDDINYVYEADKKLLIFQGINFENKINLRLSNVLKPSNNSFTYNNDAIIFGKDIVKVVFDNCSIADITITG